MSRVALFAAPALLTALTSAANPTCPFQCVPGLEKIGVGVDLTWFTPNVQSQLDPPAIKQAVVNLTSYEQQEWTNPYDLNTWGVWDQVQRIYLDQESVTESLDYAFSDYFSFTEHFSIDIEASALFGLFSAGAEFDEFFEFGFEKNATLEHASGSVDCYIAELYRLEDLSPGSYFLESVEKLPSTWWEPALYKKWVTHFNDFGTHFTTTVKAGGNFYYKSYCSSEYIYEYGSVEAEEQMHKNYLFILSEDGQVSAGAKNSNSAYLDSSTVSVTCYGGNAKCNTGNSTTYNEWVDSVHSNPWVVQMKYIPNYKLLQDQKTQALYYDVTVAYAAWSGLEELSNMCHSAQSKYESLVEYFEGFGEGPDNYPTADGYNPFMCVPSASDAHIFCKKYLGPQLSTYIAWLKGYAAAKENLWETRDLCSEIDSTLEQQTKSARVITWIGKAKDWAIQVNDYLTRAYSYAPNYESRTSILRVDEQDNYHDRPMCCCGTDTSDITMECEGTEYENKCDEQLLKGTCVSSVKVPIGLLQPQ